jgi:hypothetical protein
MADDEALERIFVNVFDCCSDDYEYDYEYDNAWRTRELNQIMNQKFCAGTLMSGTILLKLSGQTNSQLHKIPVNEEFDIVRDTSGEMNPMRIIFRRKNTHDFIGVLVHTLAYKFAYLMDEGYLKFSNAVYMGKRLVKANVQLTCAGVNDESWLTYRQKDIKNGYDCGYILGNIYEPGNRISYLLGMMSRTTLSAISYTNDNCYELNANWHIILKIRNSKIFCKFQGDDEVYILSGREERFALFYINQYRRIFYLPEIKLENGKEV